MRIPKNIYAGTQKRPSILGDNPYARRALLIIPRNLFGLLILGELTLFF